MTPSRRAFHECRMQFPRHCVAPRSHIVGIATFSDTVENSLNRIACETAPSARELLAFLASRVGPFIRAGVRHLARGPAIAGAGPLIRTGVRHFARGSDGMRVGGAQAHI